MQLTEVRPLKPFCGTYACSVADADCIDDVLTDKDGVVAKTRQPRKLFVGLVPVERSATQAEAAAIIAGEPLPNGVEIDADVAAEFRARSDRKSDTERPRVVERPVPGTVSVPTDMASSLVSRGLAEIVEVAKGRKV